jgi:Domain of Unknown Function (DUF1080)
MVRPSLAARLARACLTSMLALIVPVSLHAQDPDTPRIIGRWDVQVTGGRGTVPAWLEIAKSGHATLIGRIMHAVGSARPIGRIEFDSASRTFRFSVPRQWEGDTAELAVEGRLESDDRMTGSLVTPGGQRQAWTAVRAPSLRRKAEPTWGTAVPLIAAGNSLAGWTTQGDGENKWTVANGILRAGGGGANLMTTRKFDDFKLHVEFRYPRGSNSGVYLRGRYEVQIEDPGTRPELGTHQIGGVYGLLEPNQNAARAPGEWQSYDITLVGRRVTVVLNGKTVICDAIIPGPTGGALDANEGEPGPLLIQGDHGAVEFRNIRIAVPK